ncbi:M18 family aminopeptidase [Lachnospiraceae bacterium OttesenSCG-928-J05]|nr:M18 family aminopeptidase [Lachnospiraceae bacterium OttesenSCG-928-J05]
MSKKLEELLTFLRKSPTAFHGIHNIEEKLLAAGYQKFTETKVWELKPGDKGFVTRNDSSIIAFKIPQKAFPGFQIVANHSDSPAFKIKEIPEITVEDKYTKLNVEAYGGMLLAPWFDRPLSVAGRVLYRDGNKVRTALVDAAEDLLLIPNLAIHMNRGVNDGYAYNVQKDMLPLIGDGSAKGELMKRVAIAAGVEEKDIIGKDLFLYLRQDGSNWGANKEYFSAPRIDNLECAFLTLEAFLGAKESGNAAVYCVFDNEEVGSQTKQGAASTFLKETLMRICLELGENREDYFRKIAGSFMVSADNAHAVHPNNTEKTDVVNKVFMNEGIVFKHSANQKYTTDAVSGGILKTIFNTAKVPYQEFVNRSDVLGGSTLGSIANTQVSLNTVDIGLAQLAMHSPYETAGAKDLEYMIKGITEFYQSQILVMGSSEFEIV